MACNENCPPLNSFAAFGATKREYFYSKQGNILRYNLNKMSLKRKNLVFFFGISLLFLQLIFIKSAAAQTDQKTPAQQSLEELRKEGFLKLRTGNWDTANLIFENALKIVPNDALSLYGNSLALFNLEKNAEADEKLNILIEQLSSNKENNQLLADALVLSAVISAVNNQNASAIEKLEKAIVLSPKHFDANFSLGRAYFGNGDIDKAVYFFRESTVIKPDDIRARFFLATALERLGNNSEALAEYRNVLKINPNSADGNLGLGVLLIKTEGESSKEGLEVLQKAVQLNPDLYEGQITIGKTLIKLNRANEAIEPLQKAAQLAPNNPEPHFQLAIAYRRLGKKAEAEAENAIVKKIHESRRKVTEKPLKEEK